MTSPNADHGPLICVGWSGPKGGPCGRDAEYLVNDTPACKAHLRQQVGAEIDRREQRGLAGAVLVALASDGRSGS